MLHKSFNEYALICSFYGDKKAQRSQVPLINHIDEGIAILNAIGAGDDAVKAYCLHPVFQSDQDLKQNHKTAHGQDPYIMMLVMEYRQTANAYLSFRKISHLDDIHLSPIKTVNDMLIADKIQNFKDFMKYHYGTHPRSDALHHYFENWFDKLGIPKDIFKTIEQNPNRVPLTQLRQHYATTMTPPAPMPPKPPHT